MSNIELATFGAGCFWCVEAVFQRIKGVIKVESGYSGGKTINPTYKQICNGDTGHAEVLQITYDSTQISFEDLLFIFWRSHNPTTLNQQGNDIGTQYRSVIFYHNDTQKELAEKSKAEADKAKLWPDPIVTEISPLKEFYKAEAYHQNYYNENSYQPYCAFVITPKVSKLKKEMAHFLKD